VFLSRRDARTRLRRVRAGAPADRAHAARAAPSAIERTETRSISNEMPPITGETGGIVKRDEQFARPRTKTSFARGGR
jgi:hypothetical protein